MSKSEAKFCHKLSFFSFSIFNGVMQKCRNQYIEVRYTSFIRQDICQCYRVIDVWRCMSIFPTLIFMFFGCKSHGLSR